MYKKIILLVCFLGVLFFNIPGVLANENNTYQLISANTDYRVAGITLNEDYDFYVLTGSSDSTVTIPALYLDKPVLAISDRAFSDNATVTSLNLDSASNLVAIGDFAFKDAVNLNSSINIVKSIEVIGRSAFRGTKISAVQFENESSLTTISESAFAATTLLNSEITFPESLTFLGDSAFAGSAITNVTFGSKIATIGSFAFDNATNLTGELSIDASLELVGDHAFRGTQITEIDLSNTLIDTLLPYTFSGNSALAKVVFPKNIALVSNNTFSNSNSITELQFLGSTAVTIESYAFSSTESITKIIVSKTELGNNLVALGIFNDDVLVEVYNEPVTYTISFNTNGGSSIDSITLVENSLVTRPTDPTREGHVFVGWFKDAELNNPWNFASDTVNTNTVLYAKWESTVTNYTVTFNSNGGSSIDPITVTEDSLISKPTNPTKDKFTFDGWYKDSEFKTSWDFSADKVTNNLTLFAKWTAVEEQSNNVTLIVIISAIVVAALGTTGYLVIKKKI